MSSRFSAFRYSDQPPVVPRQMYWSLLVLVEVCVVVIAEAEVTQLCEASGVAIQFTTQ